MKRWLLRSLCLLVIASAVVIMTTQPGPVGISRTNAVPKPFQKPLAPKASRKSSQAGKKKKTSNKKKNKPHRRWSEEQKLEDIRRAIREHIGLEKNRRNCCNAASFKKEYEKKREVWGKTPDELTDILKTEVSGWGMMNKLKLRRMVTKYAESGVCNETCDVIQ